MHNLKFEFAKRVEKEFTEQSHLFFGASSFPPMSGAAISCISAIGPRCLPGLRELERGDPTGGTKELAVTVPKHNREEDASLRHNWCQWGDKSKTQHFETLNLQYEVQQALQASASAASNSLLIISGQIIAKNLEFSVTA